VAENFKISVEDELSAPREMEGGGVL